MNDLIVKSELPVISWNKETFEQEVNEIAKLYSVINVTQENFSTAKKDLASIRKTIKGANDIAIAIDNKLSVPVKTFRTEVKASLDILSKLATDIDIDIKVCEKVVLDEKIAEINALEGMEEYLKYYAFGASWKLKKTKISDVEEFLKAGLESIAGMKKIVNTMAGTMNLKADEYIEMLTTDTLDSITDIMKRDLKKKTDAEEALKKRQEDIAAEKEILKAEEAAENKEADESGGITIPRIVKTIKIPKTSGDAPPVTLNDVVDMVQAYDVAADSESIRMNLTRIIVATKKQTTLLKNFCDLVGIEIRKVDKNV